MKRNILFLLALAAGVACKAQLSISGQIRTRAEMRDGQGAPLRKDSKPAVFVSQRSRLNGQFDMHRLKLGISLQDVRVWGQDVSMINRTTTADNNGVMFHQAWADILLSDTADHLNAFSLKLGRQELIYDDQRLIGNLDWLQQGRRHDAALLKYSRNKWSVHIAAAFNQNKESASGTVYNSTIPGNYAASTNGTPMYKSMQFIYASRKLTQGNVSFLFFADQFNRYSMDSLLVKSFMPGVWSRFTGGMYYLNKVGALELTASAYYQFGKNYSGRKINTVLASTAFQYGMGKLSAGAGFDYTGKFFDPLYGTPHKFWGLMDYFYAGSGFGNGGLADYYIKTKYKPSEKLLISADVHHFASATPVAGYDNKSFGQEIDIVGNFALTKTISFEGGYSHFFSTALLASPTVKNIPDAKSSANWLYLMISVKPEFLFK